MDSKQLDSKITNLQQSLKYDENQVKEWKKELDGMQRKLRMTD